MELENIQQVALDEALVSIDDQVKIVSCNMRIDPNTKQKEATYQVVLDILMLSPCYKAILITADVPQIYMQQFWFTITKIKNSSYLFQLNNKKFEIGVELFCEILYICPRLPNNEFMAPPPHDVLVSFFKQLDAYLTYLALSIGTEVPKKGRRKGKGLMGKKATITPSKKGSITAHDNLILDTDVALKLGESISRNKAKEQEKARRVYESYELTERATSDEVSNEEGSEGDAEIISNVDERTDADKEVAKSDKVDEGNNDDQEIYDDEKVHDDGEKHDDDEVADEEMADEETMDSEKANEEMADTEKDDAEKIEEEKVDDEQARDDQTAKDDQAGALISVTQKEKHELPPSSSSLSLSSNYVLLRLFELKRKVEALSKFDHSKVIYNEVKNQLPKSILDFIESRMESMKENLFKRIRESKSYDKHPTHRGVVDEDDMDIGVVEPFTQKRRRQDDEEESVEEPIHVVAIDVEEPILDDVVNEPDKPQDDADLKKDKPTWFKQPLNQKLLIQSGTKTKLLKMDQNRIGLRIW
nr:hypothetical protein [Tanacetum cinerariifolium]